MSATGTLWYVSLETNLTGGDLRYEVVQADLATHSAQIRLRSKAIDTVAAGGGYAVASVYDVDASPPGSLAWPLMGDVPPALAARPRCNKLSVGPAGDAAWLPHQWGNEILYASPADAQARVLYEAIGTLSRPSVGMHGVVAVIETSEDGNGRGRPRLVVIAQDTTSSELRRFPNAWRPVYAVMGGGQVAIGCTIGNPDGEQRGVALTSPSGEAHAFIQDWMPMAWSPDGSALLLGRRLHRGAIGGFEVVVCTSDQLPAAWVVGEFPGKGPMLAGCSWSDGGIARRDSTAELQLTLVTEGVRPVGATRRRGIRFSDGSAERLEEYAEDLVLQLRRCDASAGRAALASAHDDLYWLGTDPALEGEIAIPNSISEPLEHPDGPWLLIDANDTHRDLLLRIPDLLRPHLNANGIDDAEIHLRNPW